MATDALAVAEDALGALRKRYAEHPKDWQLGLEVGRLNNKVVSLRKARAPKAPPAAYERQAPITDREFYDALPDTCPGCGRPTLGRIGRIGSHGWKCRAGTSVHPCNFQGHFTERNKSE